MSTALQDRPRLRLDDRKPAAPDASTHRNAPDDRHPSRWSGRLAFVIALLVLAGATALIFGPARGMRSDIDRQVELTTEQLALTREQLAVTRRQLAIAEEQRQAALEMLAIARDQLGIAREQLERSDQAIQMQREALEISRATLGEAREVNRKTPDANPSGGLLEAQP